MVEQSKHKYKLDNRNREHGSLVARIQEHALSPVRRG
jgi:hypothetical protein